MGVSDGETADVWRLEVIPPVLHNRGMRRSLCHLPIAACAAMLLFGLPPASAADDELPSAASEFLIDVWTSDDGLPQNSVISMAQTSDGYLWLSTFGGLARFDGRRFDVFDGDTIPELAGEIFNVLQADANGNLWLRSVRYQVVMGQNGHFRKLGAADGLPAGVSGLATGVDGTIWAGDDKGRLFKYEQGHFTMVKDTPPTPDWGRLENLSIDPAGDPWSWTSKACARFTGGRWSMIFQAQTEEGAIGTVKVLPDGSGALLTRLPQNRLTRYSNGKFADLGPVPGGVQSYVLSEDSTGDFWIAKASGAHSGIMRCEPNGRWSELTSTAGFPIDTVRSEFPDREGNLWIGTDGGGVVRVKHRAAQAFGLAEGMSRKVALSVAAEGTNSAWVAALGSGLDHFDGTRFTRVPDLQELGWCVRPSRQGGIWLGTYTSGLFLLNSDGTVRRHFNSNTQAGIISGPITALFETSRGDLWMGGEEGGVSRYAGGQFRSWTATNGLIDNRVDAIGEDRADAVWIGTEAGLDRIEGEEVKAFTVADGLAGIAVRSIFRDSQGSLWLGGHELTRFKDGKFRAVRTTNGLPVNNIKAIMEDDLGFLWLATPHGILRASLRELNKCCDAGKGQAGFSVFTRADGLPSNECSGYEPAIWKGGDGRLWFATLNGLAVIDPKRLTENKVPPPVTIEAVTADEQSVALPYGIGQAKPDAAQIRIPAGTARLEFRFAALSFTAPEKNRFRYRLEGFDVDWVESGTAQMAIYTRPPPGDYDFQVRACNNDGVWNEEGATLALTVAPLFWQTGWFRTMVIVLTGGLIYGAFLARLAQVERRRLVQESFARQVIETQEAERQRIAHELHDGVGQTLLLVKNRLSLGIRKVGPSSPVLPDFGQAATDLSQAIEEIRATAHALRPVELDRLGLGQALESMLERAGGASTTKISTEFDDVKEAVSREVEIQLYRIVQEAINNVLKHSKASEVNVELRREGTELRVTVQDNGIGFDTAQAGGRRGFGLSGMAERARLIGGVLSVMAATGKGCRLTVTVPLLKERHE